MTFFIKIYKNRKQYSPPRFANQPRKKTYTIKKILLTSTSESESYPFTSSSDISFDKPRKSEELDAKIDNLEEKLNVCQKTSYVSSFSLSLSKSTSTTSASSFTSSAVSMSKSKLNIFI